jgi:hypothetical protein
MAKKSDVLAKDAVPDLAAARRRFNPFAMQTGRESE